MQESGHSSASGHTSASESWFLRDEIACWTRLERVLWFIYVSL